MVEVNYIHIMLALDWIQLMIDLSYNNIMIGTLNCTYHLMIDINYNNIMIKFDVLVEVEIVVKGDLGDEQLFERM